jgi:DNA/RNA-binding domain of Phe-tRNA-synthetase-like protein
MRYAARLRSQIAFIGLEVVVQLLVESHSRLWVSAFVAVWNQPLGAAAASSQPPPAASVPRTAALLAAPLGSCELQAPDDALRATVRDMLRERGFKPTGRSKPSSEYLLRASAQGTLSAINPAVDACNAVSLHSGLPISVVDLDKLTEPLSIRCAPEGESYVFNPTGQLISLSGLPCLYDAVGPCANAVKDAQRTKTSDATLRTLSILWSDRSLITHTRAAQALYEALLADAAQLSPVQVQPR